MNGAEHPAGVEPAGAGPMDAGAVGTGALVPGTRLGRYQILKRLALGGMAELYLARQVADAGVEKVVAVKRVLPHLSEDAEFVKMFLNEAKLAANLDHSGVVHVIDFGSEGGEHFMAMEYVHGRSVQDILRAGSRTSGVPIEHALLIVREVAAALHYAHEKAGPDGRPMGLVHRDVSPSNVLVSFDGDVKLVDFGIAKATAKTRATRTGTIKGKLSYMSPEQLRGDLIDRRADVFSLGVVMYELTTGQRCFYAGGEFALINRVAAAKFERPTAVLPEFPPALEAIIVKALCASATERFATARDLQIAIEAYAARSGISLSKVSLSEHIGRTFGFEAYPVTTAIPLPHSEETAPSGMSTLDMSAIRRPMRRRTLWLTAAALAAGVVVGVGVPALLGDSDATTTPAAGGDDLASDPARGADGGMPRPSGGEVDGTARVADGDAQRPKAAAAPSDEAAGSAASVVAVGGGDDVAVDDTPAADDEIPSRPRRARARGKKQRKKKRPAAGAAKPKSNEYLPPSRRD